MELISKHDVIKALQKWNCRDYDSLTINPYEVLRNLPTIEERKEGEWIHDIHYGLKLPEHRCSICGEWEYSDTESNFCPNCGAKMKGE